MVYPSGQRDGVTVGVTGCTRRGNGMYREGSNFVTDMLYVADEPLRESSSGCIYTPIGSIVSIVSWEIISIDHNIIQLFVLLFYPIACKHLASLPDGPGKARE